MEKNQSPVGANIKKYRKEKGWTQRQLAEKAGLSQSIIAQYETAQFTPRFASLEKIAQALGVDQVDLVSPDMLQQIANDLNRNADPIGLTVIDELLDDAGYTFGLIDKDGRRYFCFEKGEASYLLTQDGFDGLIKDLEKYIDFLLWNNREE